MRNPASVFKRHGTTNPSSHAVTSPCASAAFCWAVLWILSGVIGGLRGSRWQPESRKPSQICCTIHNGNFIKDRILSGARACACMCVCVLVGCAPCAGIVIIRWSVRPGCSSSSAASHSLMPRGVCVCERARASASRCLIDRVPDRGQF